MPPPRSKRLRALMALGLHARRRLDNVIVATMEAQTTASRLPLAHSHRTVAAHRWSGSKRCSELCDYVLLNHAALAPCCSPPMGPSAAAPPWLPSIAGVVFSTATTVSARLLLLHFRRRRAPDSRPTVATGRPVHAPTLRRQFTRAINTTSAALTVRGTQSPRDERGGRSLSARGRRGSTTSAIDEEVARVRCAVASAAAARRCLPPRRRGGTVGAAPAAAAGGSSRSSNAAAYSRSRRRAAR